MPDNGTNGRWCTIFDVAALVPMRRSTEGNKMPPIKSFRRFVLYSPVVDAAQHTHHTNNGWDPWRRCRDKTENQTHDTGTLGLHVSVCLSVSVCVCVPTQSKFLFAQRERCCTLGVKMTYIFGRIEFISHLFIAFIYAANCCRPGMEWVWGGEHEPVEQ